jgi:hypothetical protein
MNLRSLRGARKTLHCEVVSQKITATLRRRVFGDTGSLYVQCSEKECQYFDVNEPPCPLSTSLFAAELEELSRRTPEP